MTTSNSGLTALITGASSGIGQELAKLFASDGYNLVLVGRSEDQLQRLAEVFTQNFNTEQITVIKKDLAKEDAAQELYDEIRAKGIVVNVLVNDAGLGTYGKFANETDWETEKDIIHLNIITLTHLTKLYLKEMVQRNEGKILNLASLVSITPMPLMSVYAATKSFVYNFTASLANELKGTNVTITALMPNATDTDFFNKAGASDIKVTDELQDPVMVAKDGYEALMRGEPKVVPGGAKNKMYEVMGHLAPQQAVADVMRAKMERKPDPQAQRKAAWAWGIGVTAIFVAGFVVASLLSGKEDDSEVPTIDDSLTDNDGLQPVESKQARDRVKRILSELMAAFMITKDKVANASSELANEANTTLTVAKHRITEGANGLAGEVKDAVDKAGKQLTTIKETTHDGIADGYQLAKDKVADVGDTLEERLAEAKNALSATVEVSENSLNSTGKRLKDKSEDVAHVATDKWEAIKNVVTRVVMEALA